MLKRFLDDGPPGTPDGVTPFFVEAGAAPTAGNAPYPPGSIVRFGTTYYLQSGTLAVPVWTSLATLITPSVLALLSTGILKVTTGTGALSTAAAGVDYSKGPWKLFSTVRLAAAAQTLSIPVVDGENNGMIRATGRLVSDGTDRVVTIKVNGSATNVALETLAGAGATASAAAGSVPSSRKSVYQFQLAMFTSSRSGTVKRAGIWHSLASDPAGPTVTTGASGFAFNDATSVITSIDIDCGAAAGFAIGSEVIVEEGIVS